MNILILAAHADDETIGVGGLLPQLIAKGHHITIVLAVDATRTRLRPDGGYDNNLIGFQNACELYGITDVTSLKLEDQRFDTYPISEIANRVASVANSPDTIISHSSRDLNKDHRIMSEVAKIIGRPKHKPISILAMEIGGTSAWNARHFQPNFYVDITATIETKLKAFSQYENEVKEFPYPYSLKGLQVMAQYRGMEAGYLYAEAYEIVRLQHSIIT